MTQDVETNALYNQFKICGVQSNACVMSSDRGVSENRHKLRKKQPKESLRQPLKSHQSAVDLGYHQREVSTTKGGANLLFGQNLPKLHGNEENLTGGPSKILLCRSATAIKILR